jgi:hypothetical protein
MGDETTIASVATVVAVVTALQQSVRRFQTLLVMAIVVITISLIAAGVCTFKSLVIGTDVESARKLVITAASFQIACGFACVLILCSILLVGGGSGLSASSIF